MLFAKKESGPLSGDAIQQRPDTAKQTTATKQFGHQSSLPDILYPLSFVGPLPPPWVSPRLFFSHPWILYTIGLIAVMIASACFPMFTFVIGRWMNGITDMSKSSQEREQVGTDAAIWMLGPLFAAFFGSFVWFLCCEFLISCLWYQQYYQAEYTLLIRWQGFRTVGNSNAFRIRVINPITGYCLF